jgi:hypothetical protein
MRQLGARDFEDLLQVSPDASQKQALIPDLS